MRHSRHSIDDNVVARLPPPAIRFGQKNVGQKNVRDQGVALAPIVHAVLIFYFDPWNTFFCPQ